jgi:hypothetical protein
MSIKIATYNGSFTDPYVDAITAFSLFNPGVHSELWIHGFRVTAREQRFGEEKNKCMDIIPLRKDLDTSKWHVVDIPITNHGVATRFVQEALASPAVYHYSILEFGMPKFMLDRLDSDLNCLQPATWDKLFCSQFVLLFLRRCAISGILDVPVEKQKLLWSVNSKGCLPSRLKIITDSLFQSSNKLQF